MEYVLVGNLQLFVKKRKKQSEKSAKIIYK